MSYFDLNERLTGFVEGCFLILARNNRPFTFKFVFKSNYIGMMDLCLSIYQLELVKFTLKKDIKSKIVSSSREVAKRPIC